MKQDSDKTQLHKHSVSDSITVSNGCQQTQKQIHSNSKWFTEEYYTLNDDGECLIISKCYMDIPKNAHKFKKNNAFSLITEMPNGRFEFDEESTEDELVIYYR
jgi:hypothetical protein